MISDILFDTIYIQPVYIYIYENVSFHASNMHYYMFNMCCNMLSSDTHWLFLLVVTMVVYFWALSILGGLFSILGFV